MPKKQAEGLDTRAMLPVYACIFALICECFLPWISVSSVKDSTLPKRYTLWGTKNWVSSLKTDRSEKENLKIPPLTEEEETVIAQICTFLQSGCVVLSILMLFCMFVIFKKKRESVGFVRFVFAMYAFYKLSELIFIFVGNLFLNGKAGRKNSFINLSSHSYLQAASWVYSGLIISAAIIVLAKRLLDPEEEKTRQKNSAQQIEEPKGWSKRTKVALALILTVIPLVIFFGIFFLNDRSSVFIGASIVCLAMLPFAMIFEGRRPQAREILPIAVLASLAAAGRLAFFMLPQFKPTTAIVIVAGAGLGPEAGFLTGAVAGFVSNFFFGQGPWTPWQMFAFGIIGFLAGILFNRKTREIFSEKQKEATHIFLLCAYGGAASSIIYGLLMDISSVLNFTGRLSWKALAAAILTGLPLNVIHGASTILFLFFLAAPMEKKLDRLKRKYGILRT